MEQVKAAEHGNVAQLEKSYKAIPLEERLDMALAENLREDFRPFMVREQWMVVKCYFARRADLSQEEAKALLHDQDHVIRMCIAKRPDLTEEMVALCVADRNPNVRHAISRNPCLSAEQRSQLMQDEDPLVSRAAAKGPREVEYRQRPGQALVIR